MDSLFSTNAALFSQLFTFTIEHNLKTVWENFFFLKFPWEILVWLTTKWLFISLIFLIFHPCLDCPSIQGKSVVRWRLKYCLTLFTVDSLDEVEAWIRLLSIECRKVFQEIGGIFIEKSWRWKQRNPQLLSPTFFKGKTFKIYLSLSISQIHSNKIYFTSHIFNLCMCWWENVHERNKLTYN